MLGASFDSDQHLPPATLPRFLQLGGKVARFMDSADEPKATS